MLRESLLISALVLIVANVSLSGASQSCTSINDVSGTTVPYGNISGVDKNQCCELCAAVSSCVLSSLIDGVCCLFNSTEVALNVGAESFLPDAAPSPTPTGTPRPTTPTFAWRTELEANNDGNVYRAASVSADEGYYVVGLKQAVVMLQADTGSVLWRVNYTNDHQVSVSNVVQGVVAVQKAFGLEIRSVADGDLLASMDTSGYNFAAPYITDDGHVLYFDGSSVSCRSLFGNYSRVWTSSSSVCEYMCSRITTVTEDLVIFGNWGGQVWALNRANGTTVWQTTVYGEIQGGIVTDNASSPMERHSYVGTVDGYLLCLQTWDGEIVWNEQLPYGQRDDATGAIMRTPIIVGSQVITTSHDGHVWSFDRFSGTQLWQSAGNLGLLDGSPLYAAGSVWVGSDVSANGAANLTRLDAMTGDQQGTFSTPNGGGTPVETFGYILVARGGTAYGFSWSSSP